MAFRLRIVFKDDLPDHEDKRIYPQQSSARATAADYVEHGIWINRVLVPPHRIASVELLEDR